jgi:hypothetical protein
MTTSTTTSPWPPALNSSCRLRWVSPRPPPSPGAVVADSSQRRIGSGRAAIAYDGSLVPADIHRARAHAKIFARGHAFGRANTVPALVQSAVIPSSWVAGLLQGRSSSHPPSSRPEGKLCPIPKTGKNHFDTSCVSLKSYFFSSPAKLSI